MGCCHGKFPALAAHPGFHVRVLLVTCTLCIVYGLSYSKQDVQPPSSSMQEKGLDAALTPAVVLLDVPSNVTTAVVSNGRSTLSRTPAAAGSLAGHHPLPRVGRTGRTTTTARRTSQ
eukprot:scpid93893/ scgid1639/ 